MQTARIPISGMDVRPPDNRSADGLCADIVNLRPRTEGDRGVWKPVALGTGWLNFVADPVKCVFWYEKSISKSRFDNTNVPENLLIAVTDRDVILFNDAFIELTRYRFVARTSRITAASMTLSSETVTVTTVSAHGRSTGNRITITGANETDYNGDHIITVTSTTSFTFDIETEPVSPATGDIKVDYYAPVSGVVKGTFATVDNIGFLSIFDEDEAILDNVVVMDQKVFKLQVPIDQGLLFVTKETSDEGLAPGKYGLRWAYKFANGFHGPLCMPEMLDLPAGSVKYKLGFQWNHYLTESSEILSGPMGKLIKGVEIFITDVCPDGTGGAEAVDPVEWIHESIYYSIAETTEVVEIGSSAGLTVDLIAGLSNEALLSKTAADETILPHRYTSQVFFAYNDRLLQGNSTLEYTPPLLGRAILDVQPEGVTEPSNNFYADVRRKVNEIKIPPPSNGQYLPDRFIYIYQMWVDIRHITHSVNFTAISRAGTTATIVTDAAHGRTTGDLVRIYSNAPDMYNGFKTITVVDATTFTYTVLDEGSNYISCTGTMDVGEDIDRAWFKFPHDTLGDYIEVTDTYQDGNYTSKFTKENWTAELFFQAIGISFEVLPVKFETVGATATSFRAGEEDS